MYNTYTSFLAFIIHKLMTDFDFLGTITIFYLYLKYIFKKVNPQTVHKN